MVSSGLFNVGSLILGLVAWILPIVALMRTNKTSLKHNPAITIVSFSACAGALCLQFFEVNQLVKIEAWSALADTCGTLAIVSLILVVGTIIVNVFAISS